MELSCITHHMLHEQKVSRPAQKKPRFLTGHRDYKQYVRFFYICVTQTVASLAVGPISCATLLYCANLFSTGDLKKSLQTFVGCSNFRLSMARSHLPLPADRVVHSFRFMEGDELQCSPQQVVTLRKTGASFKSN